MIREQSPDERHIAQSRYSREHRALVVADQSREHVRFTVPQADRRRDLAVAEGRQAAESRTGDAAHRQLQRQRDLVVVMGAGGGGGAGGARATPAPAAAPPPKQPAPRCWCGGGGGGGGVLSMFTPIF